MEQKGTERADRSTKKEQRQPIKLKWSMSIMLGLCWALPLLVISSFILFNVSDKMQEQETESIESLADRAVEVCEMRMSSAIAASRNASYIPTIRNSWKEYEKSGNSQQLYEEVNQFLTNEYRYNENFKNTIIYFNGKLNENPDDLYYIFGMYSSPTYDTISYFKQNVWSDVREKTETLGTAIGYVVSGDHLYMVRNIMNHKYEPCAVIVNELDKDSLFKSLESIAWYEDGEVYLDGVPVLRPEEKGTLLNPEGRRDSGGKSVYMEEPGNAYVYNTRQVYGHTVDYVVRLNYEKLAYQRRSLTYLTLIMFLFTIPLILLVFYFLNKNVTKPVKQLIQASRQIEKGNFGYQTQPKMLNQEFSYLAVSFNDMSDKLKNQFEKIYLEELALRDAKIMALQSQINPHFLNNTLEIINWEARMQGNGKVCGMIEALSTILEATMNRKKQELVPLLEELSYVDAYCYIIQERFGEAFHLEKQVEETLLQTMVPTLIIQPIVENAVEHSSNGGRGTLRLHIYQDGETVKIEVVNDGTLTPKDKEKIAQLLSDGADMTQMKSLSLGIRNVNRRLKIIYGNACGLTIQNDKDNRTVSTITVKLHKD